LLLVQRTNNIISQLLRHLKLYRVRRFVDFFTHLLNYSYSLAAFCLLTDNHTCVWMWTPASAIRCSCPCLASRTTGTVQSIPKAATNLFRCSSLRFYRNPATAAAAAAAVVAATGATADGEPTTSPPTHPPSSSSSHECTPTRCPATTAMRTGTAAATEAVTVALLAAAAAVAVAALSGNAAILVLR